MRRDAGILRGMSARRTALVIGLLGLGLVAATATARPAAVAPAAHCVSGATPAVIRGREVCLLPGNSCRSRLNPAYHRYLFTCSRRGLAFWWAGLLRRPLHVPTVNPGSSCPTTPASGTLGDHGLADATGPAFGPGPAYPTLASEDGRATLRYLLGWGYDGWDGTKLLWTVPSYTGPYIVRGRQIDGPGELRFDQGPDWSWKLHRELRLVGPFALLNPAATFLRAPGCYAYQVDGRGFSYLIVFEARPAAAS
jgi:hypothetical protein